MSTDAIDLLIKRELPAAVGGDRDAYGRIVAASQNVVTAVALAITRDVATSEDIAQEAFLSAWHNLRRLKNPSSFLPWLRQITRNLAHDHLRGRRNRMLQGEAADLAIQHAADPDGCPLEQALDAEREAVAADLISELPEDSREVLLLFYREGQSSKQVASLLGLSDAAVRKRLSRARQSVREDLLKRFGEFARSSAPSAAFAVGVTAALGISKPAAAAGLGLATRSIAGSMAARFALGMAGAAAGGLLGGLVAAWFARGIILDFADDDAERAMLLRFSRRYMLFSLVMVALIVATHLAFHDPGRTFIVIAVALLAMNWQLLVTLPRMMAPMFERDARRDPVGARQRLLAYRLTWGRAGLMVNNIIVIGSLVIARLHFG
ncbi:RNA polymerase sigma factor [Luteimonas wenzhouensis]|uniref:RNA polymerase sigma factor n=1 Tax=Luteimonas wenzhouensis TaxID=2599615 RepID=A0A5C5U467_9GAMM|nr:sigma-70 family RNA polymerase sigma factor [Luteimonas wenzhouensis]NLW97389.1 sigma-70 family RNA polymerase sigma factor [Xanthomonadaceae bacterium]TWT20734.1 sigma-70 family RNA polymerase sigma factor [Luteimonas wenzhouensis]